MEERISGIEDKAEEINDLVKESVQSQIPGMRLPINP